MISRITLTLLAFVLCTMFIGRAWADEDLEQRSSWKALTAAEIKSLLDEYLGNRELDDLTKIKIEVLWPEEGSPTDGGELLEQFAATIALVDESAWEIVVFCRQEAALSVVPKFALLENEETPALVRNNLRLLFARWLAQHDLYNESLEQLDGLEVGDVIDPASLLFYQSIGHHRLLDKAKCLPALARLLENEDQIPRRYSQLARLMEADLKPLKADTLDEISRIMRNVENRLGQGRAGKRVRIEEDEIITKLDKIIEEKEQQQSSAGQGQGPGGGSQPSNPMQDSNIANNKGPGNIDPKKLGGKGDWGDLPAKDRQAALQEIAKDLPAHYREVIEEYFRKLAKDPPR